MNEPSFQFRGVWIPADVLLMFKGKNITATEMAFLSIVDGLCEARGKGCWASNRYLAEMMGLHMSSVKTMIAKLRRIGLLHSCQDGERRVLETVWTRPVPETVRGSTGDGTGRIISKEIILDSIEDNGSFRVGDYMVAGFRPSAKQEKYSDFELGVAIVLREVIVQVMKIARPWRKSQWADTIRLLLKDLDGDKARVTRVFDWWKDNPKRKGLPTVINAEQFRKHFIWIESVCDKEVGPPVKIDEETKPIAKRVLMRGWPGKSRDQVEGTIQITKDRLDAVVFNTRRLIEAQPKQDAYYHFLKYVRTQLGDPRQFSENWLYKLHEQYAGWDAWNEDLLSLAFTPDHKLFHKMGRRWATTYAQDARLWDRYIKDINQLCK